MVKAIVVGAAGRMGKRIVTLVHQTEGIEVAGAVDRSDHPLIGTDIGGICGLGQIGVLLDDTLDACIDRGDVIIDFSHHEAVLSHVTTAVEHKKAAVIGTTGMTDDESTRVKELAAGTRCVIAPNMSVGVNVMLQVLQHITATLGDDFDVEIVESHHNLKKDAPSGTAVKMADVIADELNRNMAEDGVYGRKGMVGERKKREIGVHAVRAGDIVGEHTVIFGGIGERLEFTHRAHSRDNFVKGAIRAAIWIVDRPEGIYDMQDVLGLRA